MRRIMLVTVLLSCRSTGTDVRPDPAPSVTAAPPPPPSPPAPIHRVHGDVEGRFSTTQSSAVAGEPIVFTMDVRALKKPLTFFNGGDMRNVANYPLHFAVKATNAKGDVVCDIVEKPPFPSFGGPGSELTVAPGEPYQERVVINPACPALAKAGSYRVTIHRRFTSLAMTFTKPGSTTPTSCDVTPSHEDPPSWLDPACKKMLRDAPSITSTLAIEVVPFDPKLVRVGLERTLRELGKDEILRHRIERHVCGFLSCACPKSPLSHADLLAAIPATLPKSFPAPCP